MIAGPLFLLVGIGIIVYAGKRIWFYWRSLRWPCANGVITRSEVRDDADSDGHDWVAPHVEYEFEVEGRKFTGNRQLFGFKTDRFTTAEELQERTKGYAIGSKVLVWHHPRRPGLCVLERKIQRGMFAVFAAGCVFSYFATKMLLEAIRG